MEQITTMRRIILSCVFLLALPVQLFPQSLYFPLEVGNRWSYVPRHPIFNGTREVKVEAKEKELFVLATSVDFRPLEEKVRLVARGNDVDIELPDGTLGSHYRFDEPTWVHRAAPGCDDGAVVTITSRKETVETPAGTFTDCLLLRFQGNCADGGTLAQWWAPGVGLVKFEEGNIAGAVIWLLDDFELVPAAGEGLFLRGDSNSDGRIDISDMIHVLGYLFLGSSGPACADSADVNDDGALDIADPIFGLAYLFSSGPEPPPPGVSSPGRDGTPTDPFTCGDPPPEGLPGVSVDLSTIPDSLSLAEAAAGVVFRYGVTVQKDLPGIASMPLDAGQCDQPGTSGLRVFERLSGDGQSYCLCDVGLCPPQVGPVDLVAGRHEEQLEWSGRNWSGPSDTGNPMGDFFPPGRYLFEVRARGTHPGPGGAETGFEIRAAKEIELLP